MELIWASGLRSRIRAELLSRAPHEHGGAVFARMDSRGSRILAIDYSVPEDYEIETSGHDALRIDPAFWARVAKEGRRRKLSVQPVHTHPFGHTEPQFSMTDVLGEQRLLPVLERLTGAGTGAIVIGPAGESVGVWGDKEERLTASCRDIGSAPRALSADRAPKSTMFSRNVLAFGQEGQARLSQLCVGVVGASGTGSHVCEQLIRLGVGRLVVIDPDRIGTENLNRIVTAFRADARRERFKPDVIARYAKKVGGPTIIEPIEKDVLDPIVAQRLFSADALFACTDTVSSRAVLNRIAIQRFIPLWDCGTEVSGTDQSRFRAFARVRTVFAGSACLLCMGVIDPEQLRIETLPPAERERERGLGYIRDTDVPAPAVVSLNGVSASLAVMRFLEWAVSEEPIAPGQWVYRSFAGDVRSIGADRQEDCPVCGVDGRLGRVDLDVQL